MVPGPQLAIIVAKDHVTWSKGGGVQEGHRSLFNFVKAIGACMVDYSTEANSCHHASQGWGSVSHAHGLAWVGYSLSCEA